jgi:hypothetical protein
MNIYMLKREMLREQHGKCAFCGKILHDSVMSDLSHILPQRKWILKKYGEDIVHHPLNMKVTCHTDACNNGVQMSPNKTKLVEAHVEVIVQAILHTESRGDVEAVKKLGINVKTEEMTHEEIMQQVFDRR